jgi:glycosyltransferase involved in cell wall biosynthesis
MKLDELVSVVIPVYNGSQSIGKCLEALLVQSYRNIEIIVCDDNSSDETVDVVAKFTCSDLRIRFIHSSINTGPAGARNRGIKEARGSFIFFTDDDVVVPPDWITTGLRIFGDTNCVGIEGQIIYVSSTYRPRFSDRVVGNTSGNHFMMANMAYRKDVLFEVGLLNESFRIMEDRDLALRVREYGNIVFSKDFSVTHMRDQRTMKSFFLEARGSAAWVQFDIVNKQRDQMTWFIYRPFKLLALMFPPLIFSRYFSASFKSPFDYLLLLALYPRLWYERILVWKWAFRYKKFVI